MIAAIRPWQISDRTTEVASRAFTVALLTLSVLFIPMKALALTVGAQSLYLPYLGLLLAVTVMLPKLTAVFARHFAAPMIVVAALSLLYYWLTGFQPSVFFFGLKLFITFGMASLYVHLLRVDEGLVIKYLYAGAAISVAYMVYQGISLAAFGGTLPFTAIDLIQNGRGLGARYGFVRVTGFTEEPSYIAVMLVGTALMLHSYRVRSGERQGKRYWVLAIGLALCTSNSLFATLPLLLIFSLFYYFRATLLFLVLFYAANIALTPLLLQADESFFARFSSYSQFLSLPPSMWWFGIGFNQYSTLEFPQYFSPEGIPSLIVDSIASLWGGILLEGGIIFATLFCLYISRVTQLAKSGTGFALMAVLIMLANYYSPWWPIVSMALAYTVVSREPLAEPAS